MSEQEIAAQGILEILNLTHALTGLGGSALTAIVLGIIFKFAKGNLREGLLQKDDLINSDTGLLTITKNELNQEISDLQETCGKLRENEKDLYEKLGDLRDRVSVIEGRLS